MIRSRAMAGLLGAILLLQVAVAAPHAHAQQSAIQLDARVGYEGTFRANVWTPIHVTATNVGTSAQGTMVWQATNSNATFAQEIDLPNGAQKQIAISVQIPMSTRSGTISFISGGTTLAQKNIRLEELDSATQTLVAVASSDSGLLNSLSGTSPGLFNSTKVSHITLADIPEHASLLESVNVLVLHDLDTSALSPAQRTALGVWVSLGGQLVISGGSGDTKVAAGLGDLMPVDLPGGYGQADLDPLQQGQADKTLPPSATISNAAARKGSTAVYQSLIFSHTLGKGKILFTTFDIATLRAWASEPQFWGRAIRLDSNPNIDEALQSYNGVASWFEFDELALIPIWALFAIFAAYILVLGPVNYLILRRIKRLELAWATIPLIVVLFVGGIYLGGQTMRGGTIQTVQLSIIQGSEGMTDGLMTSYTGLFSPNRDTYNLGFSKDTLLHQFEARTYYASDPIEGQYHINDQGMQLWQNVVDIGEMRMLQSERTAALDTGVTSDLRISTTAVSGSISYKGTPLDDAIVLNTNGQIQELGALTDSAQKTIQISSSSPSIQTQSITTINRIRRDAILQAIPNAFQGNEPAAYLLGWKPQPGDTLMVNGGAVTPEGATLYIIRLNNKAQ